MRPHLPAFLKRAALASALLGSAPLWAADGVGLLVYNAQHESLTKAWVAGFTEETGIPVTIRNGDDTEMGNQLVQEGTASPADVFLTENSPAMVLVDITPRWDTAGVERILAFMTAHPDGFASLSQAADVVSAYMPHRPRKSEQSLRALLREDGHGRWRWHWDPRLVAELARDSEQHQDALAEAARQVKCPLLLVSGCRSDLVTPQTVAEFLALAPHARHVQLPQATHMVAGDDNDAFTATVLDYLDVLPAADAAASSATNEHVTGARS